MGGTLVLNACGTILTWVSWQKAVTMVVTGEAVIQEADPERSVNSPSMSVPFPRIIQLVRYVYVRFIDRHDLRDGGLATKRGVLARDRHTCVYCGKANAATVDHVLPQSRGGRHSSWENLAAACRSCNGRKADRTPEEAGMPLRWHPWRPDETGYRQRKIWAGLQSA